MKKIIFIIVLGLVIFLAWQFFRATSDQPEIIEEEKVDNLQYEINEINGVIYTIL